MRNSIAPKGYPVSFVFLKHVSRTNFNNSNIPQENLGVIKTKRNVIL